MIPPPLAPLRVSPERSSGLYYLVHDALGRLVAQGRYEMCVLIAAGKPLFVRPGDLFG